MWHPLGYGCTETTCREPEQSVHIKGMSSVLIPWWEGDFYGPPHPENVTHVVDSLQKTYPNAEVKFATFDDWLQEALPFRAELPVLEAEVGPFLPFNLSAPCCNLVFQRSRTAGYMASPRTLARWRCSAQC